jgi:hypothetical protein
MKEHLRNECAFAIVAQSIYINEQKEELVRREGGVCGRTRRVQDYVFQKVVVMNRATALFEYGAHATAH